MTQPQTDMHRRPDHQMPVLQTLLGFDFGRQRIGVATGQTITGTASALETLQSRNDQPDWNAISTLIRTWQPAALVVGLPLHADGSDSAMTGAARRFIRQLEGRYRLPVYGMDERLSSRAAADLADTDNAGIDAAAARIILQDWLDTHS
ncbi:MAG: Holliday junction resolvase RuvX [Pseudomonadota bacterium]